MTHSKRQIGDIITLPSLFGSRKFEVSACPDDYNEYDRDKIFVYVDGEWGFFNSPHELIERGKRVSYVHAKEVVDDESAKAFEEVYNALVESCRAKDVAENRRTIPSVSNSTVDFLKINDITYEIVTQDTERALIGSVEYSPTATAWFVRINSEFVLGQITLSQINHQLSVLNG